MSRLHGLLHILRTTFNRREADAQTREELADHIARQAAKHIASGMSPDEARRQAAIELGGAERWREETADVRRGRLLEDLSSDVRYAVRGLIARPGFALSAFATLAIGIGTATTILALADGALARPLPFPNAARAMTITLRMPIPETRQVIDMVWSYPKYELFRTRQQAFDAVSLRSDETLTLLFESGAERVPGETVNAAYFGILGVRPVLGRTHSPDEDRIGGDNAVVVVSDVFWRTRFGSRDDVLDQSLTIGGVRHRVIGVMPRGFAGLSGDAQLWVPIPSARSAAALGQAGAHNMEMIGLRAPGVSPAQAQAAVAELGRVIDEAYRDDRPGWSAAAYTFASKRMNPTIRRSLQLFGVAAGLLVLIVCANLTTLLITRGAGRKLELAIRLALGGGRARLSRQLVTESVVLCTLGGLGGVVIARFATASLGVMLPMSMPTTALGTDLTRLTFTDISLGSRGVLLALLLTLLIGLGAGALSAARIARGELGSTLRQGASSDGGNSMRGLSPRTLLVMAQVALGLVFLVASGVTLESFRRMGDIPLGWRPEGMLVTRVTLDPQRVREAGAGGLWTDVTSRVQALPSVRHVAIGSCSPLGDRCEGTTITPVGLSPGQVMLARVSPGYFDALGTRVLRGRDFVPADSATGAVIVNAAAARLLWGTRDPLATPLASDNAGTTPVVGVVEDGRYGDVEAEARPAVFIRFASGRGVVFARTDGDAQALKAPIARAIREAGLGHSFGNVQVMTERLNDATVRSRLAARVFAGFAIGAMLLAAVGVYGTLSLGVMQRSRELAVRRALGATTGSVLQLLGTETARIAIGGTIAGIAGALVLNRLLATMLYDVKAVEPVVYILSGVILIVALVAAAAVPMMRSLRIDPREAMRSD
jgi:putative ABC transport system permease protein